MKLVPAGLKDGRNEKIDLGRLRVIAGRWLGHVGRWESWRTTVCEKNSTVRADGLAAMMTQGV